MARFLLAALLVLSILVVSGCTQPDVSCQPPLVKVGNTCCADQDRDNVCDEAKANCSDDCVADICDGTALIRCEEQANGCKAKVRIGMQKGSCGVVCLADPDCQPGTTCAGGSCVSTETDKEVLERAAQRWARAYEHADTDTLYDMLTPVLRTYKTKEQFSTLYPRMTEPVVSARLTSVQLGQANSSEGYAYYDVSMGLYQGPLPAVTFERTEGVWYANVFYQLLLTGCLNVSDCYKTNFGELAVICDRTCQSKASMHLRAESGKEFVCQDDNRCDCHCYDPSSGIGRLMSPDFDLSG